HGDVLMWLMKTLLTSGCTNQRGAGQVPCTKTLVVANNDAGDDMLETASTVLLKNLSRVLGTNGK
ncbi:hypothetical protein ACLHXY_24600, partial [Klebsiella quasipneumoniae]